ncbi:hypothetical protein LZ32DRAFT_48351 [Colletotrichum eremochloae]|nr:hypothetical protein LZ32DRAFT_48351 [Colletotrichum eremochloae]
MNGRSRTSPVHPATTLARSATSKMTWVKLPNVAALACSMPPPLEHAVYTRKFRIALRLWLCLLFSPNGVYRASRARGQHLCNLTFLIITWLGLRLCLFPLLVMPCFALVSAIAHYYRPTQTRQLTPPDPSSHTLLHDCIYTMVAKLLWISHELPPLQSLSTLYSITHHTISSSFHPK